MTSNTFRIVMVSLILGLWIIGAGIYTVLLNIEAKL